MIAGLNDLPDAMARVLAPEPRDAFYDRFTSATASLAGAQSAFVCQTEPISYLAGVFAAMSAHVPVFLANPSWGTRHWEQALAYGAPDVWLGPPPTVTATAEGQSPLPAQPCRGCVMIPTGGSTTGVRFAVHNRLTLMSAADGYLRFFKAEGLAMVCALPVYHVAGLMQAFRAISGGGPFHLIPWKVLESGVLPGVPQRAHLSLVPAQLKRLLTHPAAVAWLRKFDVVLVGSGPCPTALIESALAELA